MSEYTNGCSDNSAVPIKVNRVFDSCSDKDCVTGLQVNLNSCLSDSANIVKTKCITVSDVCINIEPIPFNKGFYSVNLTFTFDVQLLAYERACDNPTFLSGTATVSKNCILYGSETNSKTFSSDGTVIGTTGECCDTINPPTALVQVLSPIVLESKICSVSSGCECRCECKCDCECECEVGIRDRSSRGVVLSIGLFYVVELVRPVTIMVPTYPYTIPQKECCAETENPCEVFDKIKFPVDEFSPRKLDKSSYNCSNNCSRCQDAVSSFSLNPPPLTDDDNENYDCGCQD